jgi:hypothetical protein
MLLAKGGEVDGAKADVIRDREGRVRFLRFGGRLYYPERT